MNQITPVLKPLSIILQNLFASHKGIGGELTWEPFRSGIEIHRIYESAGGGSAAAFLKYQPGAVVPEHFHPGYEHILVLEGSQTDANGEHGVGSLVINPPGSTHEVTSVAGCIVLIFWERPVRFTSEGLKTD